MEDSTVVWAMFQAGIKFFESPDRLPDRNDDVTLDKVNFRSDIRQKLFLKEIRTGRICVALKIIWSYCTLINIKLR